MKTHPKEHEQPVDPRNVLITKDPLSIWLFNQCVQFLPIGFMIHSERMQQVDILCWLKEKYFGPIKKVHQLYRFNRGNRSKKC